MKSELLKSRGSEARLVAPVAEQDHVPAEISAEGWISVTGCRVKTPLEDVARHEVRVRNDAVAYDDGAEFVTVTREWAGTTVDDALAELARAQSQAVRLHQEIRLRLLLA